MAALPLITIWLLTTTPLLALGARFTVLHTNDLHSHFEGTGPDAALDPVTGRGQVKGHYARLAGAIARIRQSKKAAAEPVLLVDAGDFFSGTLFHTLGPHSDSGETPELEFFHANGYDAFTLGNHEFDGGEQALARMLEKAEPRGWLRGLVATNLVVRTPSSPLAPWRRKIPTALLREIQAGETKLKIGILGLLGPDAARVSSPHRATAGFTGFNDGADGAELDRLTALVAAETARLKNRGADVVIVSLHGGPPEDAAVASVKGVDLVIGGHTHELIPPHRKRGGAWIAQTGSFGRYLGVLEWEWNTEGLQLRNPGATALAMEDGVPADPAWLRRIGELRQRISTVLQPSGFAFDTSITTIHRPVPRGTDSSSELGRLVTSILREEVNRRVATPVDVYLTSLALIRDEFRLVGGKPTAYFFSDIFRMLPIGFGPQMSPGSPVTILHLDRKEFLRLMDLLEAYRLYAPRFTLAYSDSLRFRIRSWGIPFLNRLADVRLHGKPASQWPDRISIATNLYVAGFLAKIPAMSRGWINVTPRRADGSPLGLPLKGMLPAEPYLMAHGLREGLDPIP